MSTHKSTYMSLEETCIYKRDVYIHKRDKISSKRNVCIHSICVDTQIDMYICKSDMHIHKRDVYTYTRDVCIHMNREL